MKIEEQILDYLKKKREEVVLIKKKYGRRNEN